MAHVIHEIKRVLTYDELSDSAKQKAFELWSSEDNYHWSEENKDSLKTFAEGFRIKIKDWSYGGYSHSYIRWEWARDYAPCWFNCPNWLDEEPGAPTQDQWDEGLSGVRLATWLINNHFDHLWEGKKYRTKNHVKRSSFIFEPYYPTGYDKDWSLYNPIREFIKSPDSRTLKELLDDCLNAWLRDCNSDWEDSNSEERFIEESKEQDTLFYENGKYYGSLDLTTARVTTYDLGGSESITVTMSGGAGRIESTVDTDGDTHLKAMLDGFESLLLSCHTSGIELPQEVVMTAFEAIMNEA